MTCAEFARDPQRRCPPLSASGRPGRMRWRCQPGPNPLGLREAQHLRDLDAALARACRRSRLGRRDCSSNHGEAGRAVLGLCALKGRHADPSFQ